jgi:hypothetical protein
MTSPVDVGGLPNHIKYCVSVLSLKWAIIRTSPVRIPNNWYQSIWFKVVFDFCSKMKVVKMVFWPYHRVDKHTGENNAKIKRWTWPHAPTYASCDATHLLRPDGLTQPEYQTTWPTWLTQMKMTLAWCNCDISMHSWHAMSATSQLTRQHSGTHLPRHQPRDELCWAELNLSQAASQGIGSSVANPRCNRIWDLIWVVH